MKMFVMILGLAVCALAFLGVGSSAPAQPPKEQKNAVASSSRLMALADPAEVKKFMLANPYPIVRGKEWIPDSAFSHRLVILEGKKGERLIVEKRTKRLVLPDEIAELVVGDVVKLHLMGDDSSVRLERRPDLYKLEDGSLLHYAWSKSGE